GREYDLPWLLLAAQGYQESQLDQSRRSAAGAVGVMQVLPSTARSPAVGIPDIDQVGSNIHAGTKYLRHLVDRLAGDGAGEAQLDSLNTGLFALASYNAGPGRIASVRRDAERHGLDPDVWFNQTELSAARIIGRETVDYVRAIYRHYLIYRMLAGEADTNPAAMP
ncbi:MAG TPA: transglycosylase SLT domain-containing protein, partial [Actinomycetota bacterium]|nr:transglycosylase SLT domain-containing protein [Actinomycetota bacterium]